MCNVKPNWQLEEASTHKSANTCQNYFCDSWPRPLTPK